MNLNELEQDFYSHNKQEILNEVLRGIDPEHRPESEDDLLNWYGEIVEELTKEWCQEYIDLVNEDKE